MTIRNILCIGASLCDYLLQESDDFVKNLGREKGGMLMVEAQDIQNTLKKSTAQASSAPGGSACNTAVGLARLGAKSRFLGKRGPDETGSFIENKLTGWGVDCRLLTAPATPTGRVLSIITPDAERTMMTYLGAALEFTPSELNPADFEGQDLVHLEGYLLFNPPLFDRVMEIAAEKNCKVSLDLASFEVVGACRDKIKALLESGKIHILIANEDEAHAYTSKGPEESLEILAPLAAIVVVKMGAEGVFVARGNERARLHGIKVKAVDTTGAGDLWASGFFYGLSRGFSLENAARAGNRTGSAAVSVVGAVIPESIYDQLKKDIG